MTVPPITRMYLCLVSGFMQHNLLDGQLMNKNQVDGKTQETKGKIKEVAGKITGNKSTEYKGTAEKLAGKAQKQLGDVESAIKKESK